MRVIERAKALLDYLGGATDAPPEGVMLLPGSWLWAAWWGLLSLLIVIFCGQATKFIYIDF